MLDLVFSVQGPYGSATSGVTRPLKSWPNLAFWSEMVSFTTRRLRFRIKPSEANASRAGAHFARGNGCRDASLWEDAALAYEAGLAIQPSSFPHWVQLGNVLKEAGRFHEAERGYARALALNGKDVDLHVQLGHLAKRMGDTQGVAHWYGLASALGSSDPAADLALAEQAVSRADWPRAADRFKAFLTARPKAGDIWIQLGHALKESGDLTQAGAAYEKGLNAGADPADAHLHLGHLHGLAGDAERAKRHYTLALAAGCRDDHALRRGRRSVLEPSLLAVLETLRPSGSPAWQPALPGEPAPSFARLILRCVEASGPTPVPASRTRSA